MEMDEVPINRHFVEPYVCSQCKTFIASATDLPGWRVVTGVSSSPAEVEVPVISIYPTVVLNAYRIEGIFTKAVNVWTSDDRLEENKCTLVEVYCSKCSHHLGKKYVHVENDDNSEQGIHAGWYELILEWHVVHAVVSLMGQK